MNIPPRLLAEWALRLALSSAYLTAVADRFGLLGPSGAPNVAWGDWAHFQSYVATLNFWAPASIQPALAWMATLAEVAVGLALVVPRGIRFTGLASGILLMSFALAMTVALGAKAPLNYSVWSAAAASFLLAFASPDAPASGTPRI